MPLSQEITAAFGSVYIRKKEEAVISHPITAAFGSVYSDKRE